MIADWHGFTISRILHVSSKAKVTQYETRNELSFFLFFFQAIHNACAGKVALPFAFDAHTNNARIDLPVCRARLPNSRTNVYARKNALSSVAPAMGCMGTQTVHAAAPVLMSSFCVACAYARACVGLRAYCSACSYVRLRLIRGGAIRDYIYMWYILWPVWQYVDNDDDDVDAVASCCAPQTRINVAADLKTDGCTHAHTKCTHARALLLNARRIYTTGRCCCCSS